MTYEILSSELTHEGQLSRLRVDRLRMPDGDEAEREVVEHPDAVALVPVDDDGQVVLLRQFRHPVRRYLLELPAGKLDNEGEGPADAAQRELVEEVGLAAGRLTELLCFHNSSGWTDESTTIFLAEDLRPAEAEDFVAQHEEADMQVVRIPLAEAVQRVHAGEITDAKTVIGLLMSAGRVAHP
jgi:8-oxo-dGDP phosphatase